MLAHDLRIRKNLNAININTWQRKLYRNILHGKKRIITNEQQIRIFRLIAPNKSNTEVQNLIHMWHSQQENVAINIDNNLLDNYKQYLKNQQLTDKQSLWQEIINELYPHNYNYTFYGFCILKPNIQKLLFALADQAQCYFHYPIIKNYHTTAIQHQSNAEELEWLRHELSCESVNTLVACNEPEKVKRMLEFTQPVNTAINTTLLSTLIVQSAVNILKACNSKRLERNIWLPLMQRKFAGNKSLQVWSRMAQSIISEQDVSKLFSKEIYEWYNLLQAQIKELPQQATFSEWALNIEKLLETFGWPLQDKFTEQELGLINFWHGKLRNWANQDINNSTKIDYDTMLDDLIYNCKNSIFRTQDNNNSNVTIATLKEIDGFVADKIIILGANNQLVSEDPENYFKRWKHQAKSLLFSQALVIGEEPSQIFSPLILHEVTINKSKLPTNHKINIELRPFHEIVMHRKPDKISSKLINEYAKCPLKAIFNTLCQQHSLMDNNPNEFAMIRGTVVHDVLAAFWREVNSSSNLSKLSLATIENKIYKLLIFYLDKNSRDFASMQNKLMLNVEAKYLLKIILQFIEGERSRNAFEVVQIETERAIEILGYKIKVRLDRVDQTDNGLHLIDYKTGQVSPSNWLGSPPKDPQIPLYLCDSNMQYSDASYACINKNSTGLKGFKQIRKSVEWNNFVSDSVTAIEKIVSNILSMNSKTAPIDNNTCSSCNLNMLCRPNSIIETIDS